MVKIKGWSKTSDIRNHTRYDSKGFVINMWSSPYELSIVDKNANQSIAHRTFETKKSMTAFANKFMRSNPR